MMLQHSLSTHNSLTYTLGFGIIFLLYIVMCVFVFVCVFQETKNYTLLTMSTAEMNYMGCSHCSLTKTLNNVDLVLIHFKTIL